MASEITKTPTDIARELRELSDTILDRATDLDYFGGMNNQWATMAQWLISASAVTQFFAGQVTKEPA